MYKVTISSIFLVFILCLVGCESGIEVRGTVWEARDADLAEGIRLAEENMSECQSWVRPLEGATVELHMPEEWIKIRSNPWRQVTTDARGKFHIYQVVGRGDYNYKIRILKPGYKTITREFNQLKQDELEVDAILKKE